MTTVPDRTTFENIYAGQAPWDIGKPQKSFIDVAEQITGSVLDAGCGTGDTALFLSGRGCAVTGIDFLEVPIQRAKRKAEERGLQATFLVKDALTLKDWTESAVFSGIPITERLAPEERTCGVCVVDLRRGETVALLMFTSGVQEVFAVSVLPRRFSNLINDDEKLLEDSLGISLAGDGQRLITLLERILDLLPDTPGRFRLAQSKEIIAGL